MSITTANNAPTADDYKRFLFETKKLQIMKRQIADQTKIVKGLDALLIASVRSQPQKTLPFQVSSEEEKILGKSSELYITKATRKEYFSRRRLEELIGIYFRNNNVNCSEKELTAFLWSSRICKTSENLAIATQDQLEKRRKKRLRQN